MLLDADDQPGNPPADDGAVPCPSSGVITHHWVNDAEWGDIEEIVVCGDAA